MRIIYVELFAITKTCVLLLILFQQMEMHHQISERCLRKRKFKFNDLLLLFKYLLLQNSKYISLSSSLFSVVVTRKKQLPPKKDGEIDPKLLELLISAPKKDYEKICADFGVFDFRWLLKRLNQLKKERADEQAKVLSCRQVIKDVNVFWIMSFFLLCGVLNKFQY